MPVFDPNAKVVEPLAFFTCTVPTLAFHADGDRVFQFKEGVLSVDNEEDLGLVRRALSRLPPPFCMFVDEVSPERMKEVVTQNMMLRQAMAARGPYTTMQKATSQMELSGARVASSIAAQTGSVLDPAEVGKLMQPSADALAAELNSTNTGPDLSGAEGHEGQNAAPRGLTLAGFRGAQG